MKKVLYSILFLIAILKFYSLQAQVLSISPGTNLVIKQGTVFSTDSLTLTPSADFTLSNISLTRNSTLSHAVLNDKIFRAFG